MLAKQSTAAFASCERRSLLVQWHRGGQCTRCFHVFPNRPAENGSNNSGKVLNAPKRGPNRQERAAMISNEVSMLQQEPTSARATRSPGRSASPGRGASTSSTAAPKPIRQPYTNRRSNAEKSPRSVGKASQSQHGSRIASSDNEGMRNTSRFVRGTRNPRGATEDLAAESATVPDESAKSGRGSGSMRRTRSRGAPRVSRVHNPSPLVVEELLTSGLGSHTPAAGRPAGLVADRLALLSKSSLPHSYARLHAIRLREGRMIDRSRHALKGVRHEALTQEKVPTASEMITRRMVTGQYDLTRILERPESTRTAIPVALESAVRTTMLNPSYTTSDAQSFLSKVVELLPRPAGKQGSSQQFLDYLAPAKGEAQSPATQKT